MRLVDFLKHFFCFRVVGILVRMVLERQTSVLAFDVLGSGLFGNVKKLI
jgi:hypothetical protein